MPEGFGARLRKQREERHIDLGWIAEETKIKRSLLEALERDDVTHWPSGIFRRAYVRTYAQIVGLDPDVVLREFLEVHPEPVDVLAAAAAAAIEEAARRNAAPATRLRTIVDSAIGSLAKLRRPGAIDGPLPAAPPLRQQAAPVVGPPAVAPDGAGATLVDAAAPSLPDHVAQSSLDRQMADPTNEMDVNRPGIPPASVPARPEAERQKPEALPELGTVEDECDQPFAWGQPSDGQADADPDELLALMEARLEAVANQCTELGRVHSRDEILMLLEDSARALDATGLIVWLWDDSIEALRPVLVQGYSEQVLAHLPTVRRDADNATAEAFRSARICEVAPSTQATGALVVPLLIPEGCAGVLAVELQPGIQPPGSLRPLAKVLAAALAQLVHRSQPAAQRSQRDRTAPAAGNVRPR